jgi:CRISPR-associated endonuclease Cas1
MAEQCQMTGKKSPKTVTKIAPRDGVLTLYGYGSSLSVDRGHLLVTDCIGPNRRSARFARIGHGLKRIVAIGSEGSVSLAALRWLADQNAAFVMLNRDGSVLATTGPVSPSDVRLRRAQSLAHQSDLALRIARELIDQKLRGQEHVARKYFPKSSAAVSIAIARNKLVTAKSSDDIRLSESQGALAYWSAWHDLSVSFPRVDLPRVPDHWQKFGSRMSPLTSSPRLAVNPPNAMLSYLYAVLESEARLALASLGLDPGSGVLHNDLRSRDSLACDLMEPVRPQVDAFLLDWLNRGPLRRDWFFERRDGNCRLMASLAVKLSESAQIWRRAVAPFAEGIARSLSSTTPRGRMFATPSTPLTHSRKREARGSVISVPQKSKITQPTVCGICGTNIKSACKYCRKCAPTIWRENVLKASKIGRQNTHKPDAQSRRAETQRRQNAALKAWNPTTKPAWLDERFYREQVQPQLREIQVPVIQSAIAVSEPYALSIRRASRIPHRRHWLVLARLAKVLGTGEGMSN